MSNRYDADAGSHHHNILFNDPPAVAFAKLLAFVRERGSKGTTLRIYEHSGHRVTRKGNVTADGEDYAFYDLKIVGYEER